MRFINPRIIGAGKRLLTEEGRAIAKATKEEAAAERAFKTATRKTEHEIKLSKSEARKDAWIEAASDPELKKDLVEEAKEVARDEFKDSLKAAEKPSLEEQKKKSWMARHKVMTGLGALGAGGLAYHTFGGAGTPIPNGGISPEEMGAQAAMQDMMMQTPMPQVQAANLNYEGPMMEAERARG